MASLASSSSSSGASSVAGDNQIQSEFFDFEPHPTACLPAYADLGEPMDLTFGSYRFLVGKEGTYRLLSPIFSGLLAVNLESSGSSTSSNELDEEENSPSRHIKPAES